MKIKDIMTKTVASVNPEDSVERAAKVMREYNIGAIPVCNGEEVVGILTDRDIVLRSSADGQNANNQKVRGIMSSNPVLGTPDMEVKDAARIMSERQIRRLPIIENRNLVGMVSLGDIAVQPHADSEAGKALTNISEPCSPELS
ncbi:CBS domain-containing protein [Clostridium sp. MB40-C1]|uniref:CBS domain-containing protein n=1 Tax=Clostridium sp. MB40-C1 TaxID=3070996 RepID=UPI0027DEB22E|nr:CBS domain-containing protein [Clostridium sp. MB40-C1]WMJ80606.1 CBS domain-containing protein [Clostridium sp. MB40-C1]